MEINWNIIINSFAGGGLAYLAGLFIVKHWLLGKFQKDIDKYKAKLQIEVIEATQKIITDQQHAAYALETDRKLFKEFAQVLSDANVEFLKEHDFGQSFNRMEDIGDFSNFTTQWANNPKFEFLNKDIECIKSELLCKTSDMLHLIGKYTFQIGEGRSKIQEELKTENSELYLKTIKEMSDSADIVCELYDKFIRECKNKLKI